MELIKKKINTKKIMITVEIIYKSTIIQNKNASIL